MCDNEGFFIFLFQDTKLEAVQSDVHHLANRLEQTEDIVAELVNITETVCCAFWAANGADTHPHCDTD